MILVSSFSPVSFFPTTRKTSSSEDLFLWFVLFSLLLVLAPQLFPICMFIVWKQTCFPALSPDTSLQKVYLSGTLRMRFQLQPCQQMSCRQLLLTPLLPVLQYVLRHSKERTNQAYLLDIFSYSKTKFIRLNQVSKKDMT